MDGELAIPGVTDQEVLDIAAGVVAIPSFTNHETGLARHVADLLADEGIHTELQEVEAGRFQVIARCGPPEPVSAILYNGHLDIDPLGLGWADRDPFRTDVRDGRLYGAGLHNMKAGLVTMIAAALSLQRTAGPLRRSLMLQFVVGELQGGVGTLHAISSGLRAEAAVVPEPYSVRNVITTCAGVAKFAIVVRGVAAHTSRSDDGHDAVQGLLQCLEVLAAYDFQLASEVFPALPRAQVGSVIAGRGDEHHLGGISYCADKATALVDLRYPPPFEPFDVDARLSVLNQALQEAVPDMVVSVVKPPPPELGVGGADMPPMQELEVAGLVSDISRLLREHSAFDVEGSGIVLPYSYCGNDTTHLNRAGIPSCLFGPRGHSNDTEFHVRVDEMMACAATLSALAAEKCAL